MRRRISGFLRSRNEQARRKKYRERMRAIKFFNDLNSQWANRGNLYRETDFGNKNIRYPDGLVRRVKTRKIQDTAGITFYAFDNNTSLKIHGNR